MRLSAIGFAVCLVSVAAAIGCRSSDEDQAAELCDQARALEGKEQRRSLELRREVWEEMPTAGTASARACGREVRERMGRVRLLVVTDEIGAPEAIDGCAWTADAMEAFGASISPPYRTSWARRLAERCIDVVGRAWTREPDSKRLADLNARLKILAAEPEN
jgi:hypothetical protein